MGPGDHVTFIIVGSLFVVLGILFIIWGYREESSYYETISHRMDVREFLTHWPPHPQPWALKLGGLIAIAVGLGLVSFGIYFWVKTYAGCLFHTSACQPGESTPGLWKGRSRR